MADASSDPDPGTAPAAKAKALRGKQKEAGIIRWRILHFHHKFDHVAADATASIPVAGPAIVQQNAEELRHSRCFKAWRATITEANTFCGGVVESVQSDGGKAS